MIEEESTRGYHYIKFKGTAPDFNQITDRFSHNDLPFVTFFNTGRKPMEKRRGTLELIYSTSQINSETESPETNRLDSLGGIEDHRTIQQAKFHLSTYDREEVPSLERYRSALSGLRLNSSPPETTRKVDRFKICGVGGTIVYTLSQGIALGANPIETAKAWNAIKEGWGSEIKVSARNFSIVDSNGEEIIITTFP